MASAGRDDPARGESSCLADEIEVMVVMQNRGVVLERRRGDQQVRDRTPVPPETGELMLDVERSHCHGLGEP